MRSETCCWRERRRRTSPPCCAAWEQSPRRHGEDDCPSSCRSSFHALLSEPFRRPFGLQPTMTAWLLVNNESPFQTISCGVAQVLWGALFVLAVLVRDADTAADAAAIDAIASTGMLYVLQRIMAEYQVCMLLAVASLCHVEDADRLLGALIVIITDLLPAAVKAAR